MLACGNPIATPRAMTIPMKTTKHELFESFIVHKRGFFVDKLEEKVVTTWMGFYNSSLFNKVLKAYQHNKLEEKRGGYQQTHKV